MSRPCPDCGSWPKIVPEGEPYYVQECLPCHFKRKAKRLEVEMEMIRMEFFLKRSDGGIDISTIKLL